VTAKPAWSQSVNAIKRGQFMRIRLREAQQTFLLVSSTLAYAGAYC
jgi:hypothetical protein